MRDPSKAFILAAGLGTRLRPLTLETPKPMLPLWGSPMLAYSLRLLADWGVREVLINLHHAPGPIVRYLATQPFPQLRISAVFEPEILGTGGALRKAAWFLDQPFWLLNADIVADLDPAPLLAAWHRAHPLAVCWLTEDAGPRSVRCENALIQSFHDPRGGHATFCGLHLLDRRILRYIAREDFDTIIAAYERARRCGEKIAGVSVRGSFWADIGSPVQYVQAHHDTAARLGHAGESFTLPAAAILTPRERAILRIPGFGPATPKTPIEVLPARGSDREFFRWRDGPRSAILIRWSPGRPENRFYVRHARFLDSLGLPVPRLLLDCPRDRWLAMEDLGGDTLESRLPRLPATERRRFYRKLIGITLRLHCTGLTASRRARLPLAPGFDHKLYAWERGYFAEHILRRRLRLPERTIAALAAELEPLAGELAASPQALIHRDWQSSNVLFRGGQPVMIDFQGMRRGPAAYDLASLLCDPYADLKENLQRELLASYIRRHPQGRKIQAVFPAAAIQRLCQALGAYAALAVKPGMEAFARHIPAAARQLQRALKRYARPMPALTSIAQRLGQPPDPS